VGDEEYVKVNFSLPSGMRDYLNGVAETDDLSVSRVLREAIRKLAESRGETEELDECLG
jgi:hypothetical protein